MSYSTEQNKAIVVRFNKECIQQGNPASFKELLADNVINHSAPNGKPNGKKSFYFFLIEVLRKGFPDLKVEILEQIAERDLVTTRKQITATHTGEIFGIKPHGKKVVIKQYAEHWGQSNFTDILKQLSEN